MQETQYRTRLAQEDKRWMIGDVELGSVLAPFSASLATPLSSRRRRSRSRNSARR